MNEWDLSNIRADIMLATDIEHLQAIDNYYGNIINNLQSKIDKAIEYIEEHTDKLGKIKIPKIDFNYNELSDILKEDK